MPTKSFVCLHRRMCDGYVRKTYSPSVSSRCHSEEQAAACSMHRKLKKKEEAVRRFHQEGELGHPQSTMIV